MSVSPEVIHLCAEVGFEMKIVKLNTEDQTHNEINILFPFCGNFSLR